MKLFTVAATALLASTVSARSSWLSSSPSVSPNTDGSLSVPGENPLQHCQDPKDDILTLESVDLSPNPPKAGTKLAIKAKGKLSEDIEDGAKVHLQVKYGLITIIKQTADLCDQVKNVDLECPLHKDKDTALEKEVDLPKEIPPGKYTVTADVESKDGDKITCLQAMVEFKRGGAMVINGQEAVDGKWKQGL